MFIFKKRIIQIVPLLFVSVINVSIPNIKKASAKTVDAKIYATKKKKISKFLIHTSSVLSFSFFF